MGRSRSKLHPEEFPGSGNRTGVCCHCVLPSIAFLCSCVTWTRQGSWELVRKDTTGKTARSGVWWFWGCLAGESVFSVLSAAGDWVKKGSHHTAWSVPLLSSCRCSYSCGHGAAVGPRTGERCWSLLAGLWRAIAPLMKPWCAEGEVPTAANLNPYRGWSSCVGWHRDDEPLCGECGDAKLIVSVSFWQLCGPQMEASVLSGR